MRADFSISNGIYLIQSPYELDLHNNFDFTGLSYSIEKRILLLSWRRSEGDYVASSVPSFVNIEFQDVSEFRYYGRDAEIPFTEDDCVASMGYFIDEEWAENSVVLLGPNQHPESHWLTAFSFMSGAILAVQASQAHARIKV